MTDSLTEDREAWEDEDVERLRQGVEAAERLGFKRIELHTRTARGVLTVLTRATEPPSEGERAREVVWLCAKCGHGSEEHGTPGHPAAECVADMRRVPSPASTEGQGEARTDEPRKIGREWDELCGNCGQQECVCKRLAPASEGQGEARVEELTHLADSLGTAVIEEDWETVRSVQSELRQLARATEPRSEEEV